MSLLLDALRRAEEAKRAKQNTGQPDLPGVPVASADTHVPHPSANVARSHGLALQGIESGPTLSSTSAPVAGAPLGGSDLSLAAIDTPAEFPSITAPPKEKSGAALVAAAKPGPGVSLPDEQAQREQIRATFSAKTLGRGSTAASSKKWLAPVLAVVLVAILGGGWYVWNEINKVGKPIAMAAARTASPVPAANLPAPAPGTGQLGTSVPGKAPETDQPKAEAPSPPPLTPPAVVEVAPPRPVAVVSNQRTLSQSEQLAKSIKESATKVMPAVALRPSGGDVRRAVGAEVAAGYAALQAGDLRRALGDYERAIKADPLNVDAQLGFATAAARLGQDALAARHFREALTIDPKNDYALGGLIAMGSAGGDEARRDKLENELRSLLAQHPTAAALHFALGNLHASRSHWSDAQQAYFDAWSNEPERADFAFNLAVSLDQLRQLTLARDYYRKAIALAKAGGAQFDPRQAARRLAELEAAAP